MSVKLVCLFLCSPTMFGMFVMNTADFDKHFSESWFGYKKDVSSPNWDDSIRLTLRILAKWTSAHILLTQLTRWINPKVIPAVHSMITLGMVCANFGPIPAALMFFHACYYFWILQLNSIIKIWIFEPFFFIIFTVTLFTQLDTEGDAKNLSSHLLVASMWQHMRCISFVIDQLNLNDKLRKSKVETFYDLVAYCFYLPTYFMGPFILYSDFGPYVHQPLEITWRRIGLFFFKMLKFLFWAAVLEAFLHFFYIHALREKASDVAQLGVWTLISVATLHGIFFNLSLIVFYGFGNTVATFDGYNPPPPPKCMLHYHLYSDIWRNLDVGFYQFVQKYIFLPLSKGSKDWRHRLLASAVCFVFVLFWHGMAPIILFWCVLNWVVVSLVSVATTFSKSNTYRNWERRMFSSQNSRRLKALLSAPTLYIGCISSSFFLCRVEFGKLLIKETFLNSTWTAFGIMMFLCYCFCQISIETKRWETETLSRSNEKSNHDQER